MSTEFGITNMERIFTLSASGVCIGYGLNGLIKVERDPIQQFLHEIVSLCVCS